MELLPVMVKASVTGMSGDNAVIVLQSSGGVAPYTVLTTQATGRFSDNAFLLFPGVPTIIQFIPFNNETVGIYIFSLLLLVFFYVAQIFPFYNLL
jgi:hypothetical protein